MPSSPEPELSSLDHSARPQMSRGGSPRVKSTSVRQEIPPSSGATDVIDPAKEFRDDLGQNQALADFCGGRANGFSAGFGCYISGRKRDETDVGLLLRQAGGAPRTFAWVQGAAERGSVVAPPGTPGLRRARVQRRRGSGEGRGQRGEFGVAGGDVGESQLWPD